MVFKFIPIDLLRHRNPLLFVESDGNFISGPAALFSLVRERFIINPSAPPQRKRREEEEEGELAGE